MILRTVVDIEVPDTIGTAEAEKLMTDLRDYHGSVNAYNVLKKVISETKPQATYHVHDGNNDCRACRRLANDGVVSPL